LPEGASRKLPVCKELCGGLTRASSLASASWRDASGKRESSGNKIYLVSCSEMILSYSRLYLRWAEQCQASATSAMEALIPFLCHASKSIGEKPCYSF